jgi:hypothetical protein
MVSACENGFYSASFWRELFLEGELNFLLFLSIGWRWMGVPWLMLTTVEAS